MKTTIIAASIFVSARVAFSVEHEIPAATATPTPDKSQYSLFDPTPIDLRRPYNTDRPSKTDSAYTIDAGTFQIETDIASWTLNNDNNVRTRTWIVANTNFKIGLTNWMDLQIIPQLYVNRRTSGSNFGMPLEQDGFGDTTIRLKVNFLGNDGGDFVIGFLTSLKIPTNMDHLGNNEYEPAFEVPMCRLLPYGFTLFGMSRIDILDEPGDDRRILWSNPIGVSRTIAGKLSGYVEFYNAVNLNYDRPWIGTLDVGLIYQVTPNFSVDINSFFGLTDSADDCNVFIGFARRF